MAEKNFAQIGYLDAQGNFNPKSLRAQDVIDKSGVSAETHMNDAGKHLTTAQAELITGAVQAAEKGAAGGIATLGADGKLTASQIDLTAYQCKIEMNTYAEMLAKDTSAETGIPVHEYVFVKDASGDPTVNSGWAIYRRTSAGNTADDFTKTSEQESLDVALPDFEEINNRITANATASSTAQTTADTAITNAAAAQALAEKESFCVVSSEAELAGKNLRPGAMVFMLVDNN